MHWPLPNQTLLDHRHGDRLVLESMTQAVRHRLQRVLALPEYFSSRDDNYLNDSLRSSVARSFVNHHLNFKADGLDHLSRVSLAKLLDIKTNYVIPDADNCQSLSTYRALSKYKTEGPVEQFRADLIHLASSYYNTLLNGNGSHSQTDKTRFFASVTHVWLLLSSHAFLRDLWPSREADLRLLEKGYLPVTLFPLVALKRFVREIESSMRSFVLGRQPDTLNNLSVSVANHGADIMVKLTFPVHLPVMTQRRRNRPPGLYMSTQASTTDLSSEALVLESTSMMYDVSNRSMDDGRMRKIRTAQFCFIAFATFINTSYWLFTHSIGIIVVLNLLRDPSWLFVTPGLLAHIPSSRAYQIDDFMSTFGQGDTVALEVIAKTLFLVLVVYLVFSRAAKCVFLTQHFGYDHEHIYDSAGSLGKLKLYVTFIYKVHSAEGLAMQQITFWTFVDGFVGFRDPSRVRLAGPCQHTYTICRDEQGDLCFILLSELMAELHHDSQVIFDKPIPVCVKLRHLSWLGNNAPVGLEKGVYGVASVRLLTYKNSYYNTRQSLFYDFPAKNVGNISLRSNSEPRMADTSFIDGPSYEG